MIIYATKQTIERYGLQESLATDDVTPARERNLLLKWGAKIFYFEGKKCLQLCNFASKFTLTLFNVKKKDIGKIRSRIEYCMMELYKHDPEALLAVARMLDSGEGLRFAPLKDKRVIATLNSLQQHFEFDDSHMLRRSYAQPNPELDFGSIVNFDYIVTDKINGKTEYIYPAERFRELVIEAYGCK